MCVVCRSSVKEERLEVQSQQPERLGVKESEGKVGEKCMSEGLNLGGSPGSH